MAAYKSFQLKTLAILVAVAGGCQAPTAPPPRVAVPARPTGNAVRETDSRGGAVRDVTEAERQTNLPPPPFDDVPLVSQAAPEQRAYVNAYGRVGRPRIAVFINRSLEGQLLPVNEERPLASVERTRTSNAGVTVDNRETVRGDGYYRDRYRDADLHADRDRHDSFKTDGPAEYRDRVDVYLAAGNYDEAQARSIDYEAMENILTDWLAADGKIEIVSPVMVRDRLTDQQLKDLQSGRPQMAGEVARLLDTDVLVQVAAKPTRQTSAGLEIRLVAEAINVRRGGQSIARAVVDVPPPLDKQKLNRFTRFVARKLMDGMIASWSAYDSSPPPPDARPTTEPNPDGQPLLPRVAPQAQGDVGPASSPSDPPR